MSQTCMTALQRSDRAVSLVPSMLAAPPLWEIVAWFKIQPCMTFVYRLRAWDTLFTTRNLS